MARTPVVEGWFTGDAARGTGAEGADTEAFRLLGSGCSGCGAVFFPPGDDFCRNPGCAGGELGEVPLPRHGRIWSYTDSRYRPPLPYPSDPHTPWESRVLLAVELALPRGARIVVLGQGPPGVSTAELAVGMAAEAVPGVLYEEGETVWTTWHWRPVPGSAPPGATGSPGAPS
ncbi:zinc ribbon domain-containing protein [Streptomyces sp. NPDC000594]|uniref:Zn-ribbon domain-containing OB-fold protein n=1 Tax=Streptomyces sp. NPDC000594 TaxID=3154261 RepID=UPI00331B2570